LSPGLIDRSFLTVVSDLCLSGEISPIGAVEGLASNTCRYTAKINATEDGWLHGPCAGLNPGRVTNEKGTGAT
jgi:hypothetical protein